MNNSFARIGKGIVESDSSQGFEFQSPLKKDRKK